MPLKTTFCFSIAISICSYWKILPNSVKVEILQVLKVLFRVISETISSNIERLTKQKQTILPQMIFKKTIITSYVYQKTHRGHQNAKTRFERMCLVANRLNNKHVSAIFVRSEIVVKLTSVIEENGNNKYRIKEASGNFSV